MTQAQLLRQRKHSIAKGEREGDRKSATVTTGKREVDTGDAVAARRESTSTGVVSAALLQAASERVGSSCCDLTSDWTRYGGRYNIHAGGGSLNWFRVREIDWRERIHREEDSAQAKHISTCTSWSSSEPVISAQQEHHVGAVSIRLVPTRS